MRSGAATTSKLRVSIRWLRSHWHISLGRISKGWDHESVDLIGAVLAKIDAPMDRLTNRRDKTSLSGPRYTRLQYQTGPSTPAHRRKCGLADSWESSACRF